MHLFNHIKFRTPESVELEFTLAGIGSRAWALIIDYHVLAVTLAVFFIIWLVVSIQLIDFWTRIFGARSVFWLMAIAFITWFVIYVGYFVFFETIWQGQTPGKRFAKIRVVRDDGRPIGLQQATLRGLLRPFDEVMFIGALLIMFTRREKRLGDLAAGTIVIQTQTFTASASLKISEQAKTLYEYLLQITDLSPLLPDDFAIIREYLQRRGAMSAKARTTLAQQLAQQVKAIIDLDKLPENVSPDVFLEAIYLAYQHREY
ncbi:RDD family protein [Nostocaceae cyanobacterium CENA369]|uniref:RDD family protein n=1 Tax=Dendronalium phyllosphericum CENA369 TaxID=1725256 RepID=A0A8J7IE34_9NOST|nr:RDD family protein [Dendronalium phyllosphericum]MBH8576936.1 RDD family protein [Dendronalium phyllosphericum CENA369]